MGADDIHVQTLAAIATSIAAPESRRRIDQALDAKRLFHTLKSLLAGQPLDDEGQARG
jgi:hypothetical protein